MPIEQLVQQLCDYKHSYTQFGSVRPYGVSFMYAGYDEVLGFQLYNSDPSGNYFAWKANATGANHVNSISILKSDYDENMSLDEGIELAAKILCKTMDTTNPEPERVEMFFVTKRGDEVV